MHSLIINVAADPTPEMLLLVQDVVLHARDDARTLRSLNRLCYGDSGHVRVWAEGFKVAAASGIAT